VRQGSAGRSSRRLTFVFASILVFGVLLPAGARALSLDQVGTFASPTFVTSDPADPDRLFVVEREGRIELVENGQSSLFLDLEQTVLSPPDDDALVDHGLYSMAFSPDFATDHLFYIVYSRADDPDTGGVDETGQWQLAEGTANGDTADPDSLREVLTIEYPEQPLHYGGQLQFGPDGYLYVSTGDGGPQGDPDGNAQDLGLLYGKILRIDPHGAPGSDYSVPADNPFAGAVPGEDEIWSYGLRNPWRFSFDRSTGDLVIGDVGFNSREEVDFVEAPDPGKGTNFGWNCREGTIPFSTAPPCDLAPAVTEPVFDYGHVDGNCSVTGGYVVRDPALTDLYGRYLYSDWCGQELRTLDLGQPAIERSEGICVGAPISFGEDAAGRLYVTSLYGAVYRITAEGSSGACPSPPDETPPDTRIDSGPEGTIKTDSVTFAFSGVPADDTAKIQCRLDDDPFAECSSPTTFSGLTDGSHTVALRAEDADGNRDPSPATRTFTVDTSDPVPPDTGCADARAGLIAARSRSARARERRRQAKQSLAKSSKRLSKAVRGLKRRKRAARKSDRAASVARARKARRKVRDASRRVRKVRRNVRGAKRKLRSTRAAARKARGAVDDATSELARLCP
jgi:Glucose / Sorbosone dehydrogenase